MDFLYIAGWSATGKTTLLMRLLDPAQIALRNLFGVEGPAVGYIVNPGAHLGANPPGTEIRDPDQLREHTEGVAILQWQDKLNDDLLLQATRFPDSGHRLLVLWVDDEEMFRRHNLKHRTGWPLATMRRYELQSLANAQRLQLPITYVHANWQEPPHYQLSQEWPGAPL